MFPAAAVAVYLMLLGIFFCCGGVAVDVVAAAVTLAVLITISDSCLCHEHPLHSTVISGDTMYCTHATVSSRGRNRYA